MTRRTSSLVTLLTLGLIISIDGGCGPREGPARQELEKDGFTDLVLTRSGDGFSFHGKKDGKDCEGTISVKQSFGASSTLRSESCRDGGSADGAKDCSSRYEQACLDEALAFEKASNFEAAIKSYREGCNQQDGAACTNLGHLYDQGQGVPADRKRADELYAKGCQNRSPVGCSNLGHDHALDGKNDLAFAKYKEACAIKQGPWCAGAGWLAFSGSGTAKDPALARKMFDEACTAGDGRSCGALGAVMLVEKKADEAARGRQLLTKACDDDVGEACSNLGVVLRDGTVTPSDLPASNAAFEKGCGLGENRSCLLAGVAAEKGQGQAKDLEKAVSSFRRACDLDEMEGCLELANLTRDGHGVAPDKEAARALYEKACERHVDAACKAKTALR